MTAAPQPSFDLSAAHRWFAIEWNNAAWDALESAVGGDAPQAGDDALHLAHGSLAHWGEAGNALNHVRALCVVANAESLFGAASSAVKFAEKAIQLAADDEAVDGLADWDQAFLYDARMRAARAALQEECSREQADPQRLAALEQEVEDYLQRAEAAGAAIADEADRKFFFEWFAKQ